MCMITVCKELGQSFVLDICHCQEGDRDLILALLSNGRPHFGFLSL